MSGSATQSLKSAKYLLGQKVMFDGNLGIVKSHNIDGGDYETNHQVSVLIQCPNSENFTTDPKNVRVLSDEDYEDYVYLAYGIEPK